MDDNATDRAVKNFSCGFIFSKPCSYFKGTYYFINSYSITSRSRWPPSAMSKGSWASWK